LEEMKRIVLHEIKTSFSNPAHIAEIEKSAKIYFELAGIFKSPSGEIVRGDAEKLRHEIELTKPKFEEAELVRQFNESIKDITVTGGGDKDEDEDEPDPPVDKNFERALKAILSHLQNVHKKADDLNADLDNIKDHEEKIVKLVGGEGSAVITTVRTVYGLVAKINTIVEDSEKKYDKRIEKISKKLKAKIGSDDIKVLTKKSIELKKKIDVIFSKPNQNPYSPHEIPDLFELVCFARVFAVTSPVLTNAL